MKTGMIYIGLWLLLLLAACSHELELETPIYGPGEEICLELQPDEMQVIETRSGKEVEADSRVEHVILYVFDETGTTLLTRYQQDLEHPDLKVRVMLPTGKNLQIHAVCNYHNLWNRNIGTVDDLNQVIVTIDQPDGAFNGAMIMHGAIPMAADKVNDKSATTKIPVSRIAARVELNLKFEPEISGDEFYLTSIRLCNIPKQSWLMQHDRTPNDTITPMTTEDAVYDTDPKKFANNYFSDINLPYETTSDPTGKNEYHLQTYLFENRRGCEPDDKIFTTAFDANKEMWQTLKGKLGKGKYTNSSYLLIEGYYKSGKTTAKASYSIYLGRNNYKDFNVRRNTRYIVTASIKTCNKLDTRVDVMVLGGSHITSSFNNPLDAHFNAVPCFGYTRNEGWELYVEEPDKHPWLEISFSSQYRPRIAGKAIKPEEDKFYAGTRFEGKESLSSYFYVHTDEYIPENPAANGSLNNTLDEKSWRKGTIVLRDKKNGSTVRLEVKQRPAQVVRMPVKDLLGHVKFYNEYYIEYELERKNITWGFMQYGANPVMTSMINDRWDGLANTRRLYEEAIKMPKNPNADDAGIYMGAYNGYYTVNYLYPFLKDTLEVIKRIPENHMIKYVLGKNRDRNGNGYIDYDEIVWYVPALDELAYLKEELGKTIVFQNSDERFHSSTPYLAGYSAEVPGRAFYVKMGQGEKAFAMRDRQYNVLCCRRKNAWTGDPNSGIGGDITIDPGWNKPEEEVLPKN